MHIKIKYNDSGKITNWHYDHANITVDFSDWTEIDSSDVPDVSLQDNEIPVYYFDDTDGSITVEKQIVETTTV